MITSKSGKREKKSNDKVSKKDICQTPAYALEPLLPYIKTSTHGRVWECADGEGYLKKAISNAGHSVWGTDIIRGGDFLELNPLPDTEFIITNPPFSLKYRFLKRCYELEKPFALLMPVDVLGSVTAQRLFKEHGFELMLLNKRIDFKMPNKGWGGAGAWFPVAWFCWKLLPEQIMYGEINK